MCTAMTLSSKQGEIFFGRNMDFSYDIAPHLYIIPRGYKWQPEFHTKSIADTYRFIGIGQELDGVLGFFDGVNECGFCAAALYFAGYASYANKPCSQTLLPVASFEFLHFILGRCSCIRDLRDLLSRIEIVGAADPVTGGVAPLHWIVVDKSGECVVIEQTEKGLDVMNNPMGVLANSPDFPWHMTNLRNYMEATPNQTEEALWGNVKLTPFGQAGGTGILPGGFTSPERFVRTSYLKSFLPLPLNQNESIVSFFHVMENVAVPKGAVLSGRGTYDYTRYTALINVSTCEYYFKTYDNLYVGTAGLFEEGIQNFKPLSLGSL